MKRVFYTGGLAVVSGLLTIGFFIWFMNLPMGNQARSAQLHSAESKHLYSKTGNTNYKLEHARDHGSHHYVNFPSHQETFRISLMTMDEKGGYLLLETEHGGTKRVTFEFEDIGSGKKEIVFDKGKELVEKWKLHPFLEEDIQRVLNVQEASGL